MTAERWNSNLHAFEGLLEIVPTGALRGLDVGCGEGETSRRLRKRVPSVVGLDTDASSIEQARQAGDDIDYVVGDLFGGEIEEDSFDVVTAVAVLHHVDHRVEDELLPAGGRGLGAGALDPRPRRAYDDRRADRRDPCRRCPRHPHDADPSCPPGQAGPAGLAGEREVSATGVNRRRWPG